MSDDTFNPYDGQPHRLIQFSSGLIVPASTENVLVLEQATESAQISGVTGDDDFEFEMRAWLLLVDSAGLRVGVNLMHTAWWKIGVFRTDVDGRLQPVEYLEAKS